MKNVSTISKSANNMRPVAKQSYSTGFSLIELMIVVAVIAILAAIAYPSFIDSVRKGRRADAQQGLMQAAHKLENYYARNATYTEDLREVGYSNEEWNDVRAGSDTVYYQIRVITGGCNLANCFILESQSQGDQANDTVCWFSLRSTGQKQMNIKGPSETTCPGSITKNGWK